MKEYLIAGLQGLFAFLTKREFLIAVLHTLIVVVAVFMMFYFIAFVFWNASIESGEFSFPPIFR